MKKLLMGSVALMTFSASILLFQISCKKDATAQSTQTTIKNKILYTKNVKATPSSLPEPQIWIANYDGSSAQRINITVPTGTNPMFISECVLSPDATKIFFTVSIVGSSTGDVYSANIDGTNMIKILTGTADNSVLYDIKGAY